MLSKKLPLGLLLIVLAICGVRVVTGLAHQHVAQHTATYLMSLSRMNAIFWTLQLFLSLLTPSAKHSPESDERSVCMQV